MAKVLSSGRVAERPRSAGLHYALRQDGFPTRSTLEGERKQVTVLFPDVKGSMDLAEEVEAEQWRGIMKGSSAFERLHPPLEGTINQYTGGVTALFGAFLVRENHARRAYSSAVSLQTADAAFLVVGCC